MKSIKLSSPSYRVVARLRPSKARYSVGVEPGDILTFITEIGRTSGASSGNYALTISIFVNGEFLTTCSQNEFLVLFEEPRWSGDTNPIFELIEEV